MEPKQSMRRGNYNAVCAENHRILQVKTCSVATYSHTLAFQKFQRFTFFIQLVEVFHGAPCTEIDMYGTYRKEAFYPHLSN